MHAHLYGLTNKYDDYEFLPILEYVMEQKEASPYLFSIWKDWRLCYQVTFGGSSNYSEIYNDYYNVWRLKCAQTLFDYIEKHPKDGVMIYGFLNFAIASDYTR